jgi:hypothetical protein
MQPILKKDELLKTADALAQRIHERFKDSGLARVAAEIVQLIQDALVRAEKIRRPNLLLRAGLVLLAVAGLVALGVYVETHREGASAVTLLVQVLDSAKGSAALLAATALFLWTLEVRLKRRRALQAIHELRAIAHIIDMHQLAKSPDRLGSETMPVKVGGRLMTREDMRAYLHYCTELLALVSKIGQLYVEDFPDTSALDAVNQFENLATSLSGKIWQKIMILEHIGCDREQTKGQGIGG